MQRMELYTSGVKVSKLGSLQDRISRQFLYKKLNKDLILSSLLAHIASGVGEGRDWYSKISSLWSEYTALSTYTEGTRQKHEEDSLKAWEYWKTITPVITKVTGNSAKPLLHVNLMEKQLESIKEDKP